MTTVLAFHSFRPGVGRTQLAANVAALLVESGGRVGAVDFDDDAVGIPALFGLTPETFDDRLTAYFWSRIPIEETAIDVTTTLSSAVAAGRLFVLPSVLWREWLAPGGPSALDQGVFKDAIGRLLDRLALDWLVVEAGAGLADETLLSAGSADILIEVVRRDAQDLQATAVMLELAERLGARQIYLAVSQSPPTASAARLRREFEAAYRAPVVAVLPLAPELAHPDGSELLAVTRPAHPWSVAVRRLVTRLRADKSAGQRLSTGEWTIS